MNSNALFGLDRILTRLSVLTKRDYVASATALPLPVAQVLFGVVCAGVGLALRLLIDNIWQGAGPFGLMVPAILVATLFGRLLSGLVCLTLTSLHAWYFVLPIEGSFAFELASDGPRVVVNIAAGFFVVLLAELFRSTMRRAMQDREILLRELEHRVKNNFASVSGLLRLQLKEHADDPTVKSALQAALGRIESYAIANSHLYRDAHYTGTLDLKPYLDVLVGSVELATPDQKPVTVERSLDSVWVTRDRAISLGLLVNEIITNAAKHAFGGREYGTIDLVLRKTGNRAQLVLADNGSGLGKGDDDTSLGTQLIRALTQQANTELDIQSDQSGTRYSFAIPDVE